MALSASKTVSDTYNPEAVDLKESEKYVKLIISTNKRNNTDNNI